MRTGKRKIKKYSLPTMLLVLVIAVISIIYSALSDAPVSSDVSIFDYPLVVSFIDVGQGDCELIQCGEYAVLIDGGEREKASVVNRYLETAGVEKIDCYILTHPHSDHIGAAANIINSNKVGSVFMTTFSEINMPTTKTYENTLIAIEENNLDVVAVTAGESYTFGELTLDIIAPFEESDDYNDMSIVVKAKYKDVSFLFTGDTTTAVEKQILAGGSDISSNVLKIAHHGSETSSSEEFLSFVSPEIAVISCGAGNSYGHPHDSVVNALDEKGIKYYRTDLKGTVVIASNGKSLFTQE